MLMISSSQPCAIDAPVVLSLARDGMLHAVTFDGDGTASYANRWIRSKGLEAEIEGQRMQLDELLARERGGDEQENAH